MKLEGDLKVKLCGQKLYPAESVNYFGGKIGTTITWQHRFNDNSIKFNRANVLFFKMGKYISLKIVKFINFAIFYFYLFYCCIVWAQNFTTIQQMLIVQKKAVRIISFNQRIPIPVPSLSKMSC